MNLSIDLKYCYGINSLKHNFAFTSNTFLIYASNGSMKSSLAQTFDDISEGKKDIKPRDRYFKDRPSKYEILSDGKPINPKSVLVIHPYNSGLDTDAIGRVLVNEKLKKDYKDSQSKILEAKDELFGHVEQMAGLTKSEIEIEIHKTYMKTGKTIFQVLEDIESDVHGKDLANRSSIPFSELAPPRVRDLLNSTVFQNKLQDYIKIYEDLVENTRFFKKDFNHFNADAVLKALDGNGYFGSHSINLKSQTGPTEVSSAEELKKIFQEERLSVLDNERLKTVFEPIEKLLSTGELRKFRNFLFENRQLVPELKSPSTFKKTLWTSYFQKERVRFDHLLKIYRSSKSTIEEITKQAAEEAPLWKAVVEQFVKRFNPPFRLEIENQQDVILKTEVPSLSFYFTDKKKGEESKTDHNSLEKYLSQGEKRALYILNIIFKIERKKFENENVLLIVDDIADSFDYKNKYAIAQYLIDNHKNEKIKSIILTHNFDFYRMLSTRLYDEDPILLFTQSSKEETTLRPSTEMEMDPFKFLKKSLKATPTTDNSAFLPLLPFIRNLVEYQKSNAHPTYEVLTEIMHAKPNSETIKVSDITKHYKEVLDLDIDSKDETSIQNLIISEAKKIVQSENELNLGEKIVASMAIRVLAERFMLSKISIPEKKLKEMKNPTPRLAAKYKSQYDGTPESKIIDKVCLMTPENIHINSFMYEPLIDISSWHLKELLSEVESM